MDEDRLVEITYPCRWTYQVIGREEIVLRAAIAEAVGPRACDIRPSRRSRTGKFCSLHLEIEVSTEADRLGLFATLRSHSAVAYVL